MSPEEPPQTQQTNAPDEASLQTQQLLPLFRNLFWCFTLLSVLLLLALVGIWDEDTPDIIVRRWITGVFSASMAALAWWMVRLSRNTVRQARQSAQRVEAERGRQVWRAKGERLRRAMFYFWVALMASGFLVDAKVGLLTSGLFGGLLLLALFLERKEMTQIELTAVGLQVTLRRPGRKLYAASDLRAVHLRRGQTHVRGINVAYEYCELVNTKGEVVLSFRDRFEWPLRALAAEIARTYGLPLHDDAG